MRHLILIATAALLVGCATTAKPVFYPNTTYETMGRAAAESARAQCALKAEQAGASSNEPGALGHAAGGAVGGALVGAAVGSVFGNAKTGAQAGAAQGAASGLLKGSVKKKPDSLTRRFIERCLREQGYEVIGWK